MPIVSVDTSIELAQPFDRELIAAVELAVEWGVPTVRVFGGESQDLNDVARRLDSAFARVVPSGVTIALETHDAFSSAARVAELLRLVDNPSFAAV